MKVDSKKNIIVLLFSVVIFLIVGVIGICVNMVVDYAFDVKEDSDKTGTSQQVPVDKVISLAEIDDETKNFIDSVVLYTSIYGNVTEDKVIYWTLMYHIENTVEPKQSVDGYEYVISKEVLEGYLDFFSEEKDLNKILDYQNDLSINYNNYKISEENNSYVIYAGGHGGPSNTVTMNDKKVESNQIVLTYQSSCVEDSMNLDTIIDTGTVTIIITYDTENDQFKLESSTFEKSLDQYSCYWS